MCAAQALANRLIDAKSTVVITANGVMRGPKPVGLYSILDVASASTTAPAT